MIVKGLVAFVVLFFVVPLWVLIISYCISYGNHFAKFAYQKEMFNWQMHILGQQANGTQNIINEKEGEDE